MTDAPSFRDLSGLSALLRASLGAYAAVAVIAVWSGWLEIDLLRQIAEGVPPSEEEGAASDWRQAAVAGVQVLVFLVAGVLFLRWTFLANRNARAFAAGEMEFTPGWAVGWYFIPVATLWKPYQALSETFKASHPDFTHDWRGASRPGILPLWWALWIISTFLGQAVFRSALRAETADELLASSTIILISDAMDVPLGIVAMFVVSKLQARQSEKARRLTDG